MTPLDPMQGSQAVYNFWLGLIPQFLGQFGGMAAGAATEAGTKPAAGSANPAAAALAFPLDQIAKAAALTQQSLQALSQSINPLIQASGVPGVLDQWTKAMPALSFGKPGDGAAAAASAAQAWMAPWSALMPNVAGAAPIVSPQGSPPAPFGAPAMPMFPAQAMPMFPWQAMAQPWIDVAGHMAGATPAQLTAVFDRTYGALSDALGLSPARKLHAAWQDLATAAFAQQEARAKYALLVQSAFAQGLQRLMADLAAKADSGERVDSVLALLKLWATKTEEVVHETLQSDAGLAATAALTRSGLIYRKKMQSVASIVADVLDMATRRELDEAYREIQALKRELRASRAVHARGKREATKSDAGSR